MIWFTSDLHLGHESLATQKRGYHSLAAMEHLIIQNVNVRVAPTDTLCILGDFSFRCTVEHARELREKIVCRKVHLIAGNHDKDWSRPEVAKTFSLDPPLMRMKTPEGQVLVLCHYPLLSWEAMRRGAIMLHGHIHSGMGEPAPGSYNTRMREQGILRYDVGIDANGMAPVSLDEVLAWFDGVESREDAMLDATSLDVMVYVDDVEACRRYWTEKLGFREAGRRPGPAGSDAWCLSFGTSGARVVLMGKRVVEESSPEVSTAMPSLLFHVANVDAYHDELEGRGITLSPISDAGGMRSFAFCDGEGHWMAAAQA
ncbi:MAG: metallophosphoesterase [Olsenella sp.]|jgi:calcineurin-like phosphoesterase family protein/catechol 2,3-dioxygenase-like lactoylglutathione lyase family enzyme|nr:metallophosphoesterase [Olsenella sp.]